MKPLVNIPGTQVWVNPRYVTSVRSVREGLTDASKVDVTEVEYEGRAGYRTRTTSTRAGLEEVVAALNADSDNKE